VEICKEFPNVEVVVHKYPGNQAEQFNWALDNLNIETEWILRLDADEYLTSELIAEMQTKLPTMDADASAVVLPLGRAFHGKLLKHGIVKGVKMIRLFRKGSVRYEQRLMDEHLEVLRGKTITFEHQFVDDSLISMAAFTAKHNNYSNREAALLLDAEYRLTEATGVVDNQYADEVAAKRKQKEKYAKMPLYWRSFGYFFYRYIVKLGFLDGRAGFEWDFFQGLWYRLLIDAKVAEARRLCGKDKEKLRQYVNDVLGVKL
jgi:glycosyltransferase involved in cell wall biosynthesis